jgi:hypothetical protein
MLPHRLRPAAAVVLAAPAPRSSRRPLLAGRVLPGGAGLLAGLVDQILGSLPGKLAAAAGQAAHLPVLDDAVAEAATGVPGPTR